MHTVFPFRIVTNGTGYDFGCEFIVILADDACDYFGTILSDPVCCKIEGCGLFPRVGDSGICECRKDGRWREARVRT